MSRERIRRRSRERRARRAAESVVRMSQPVNRMPTYELLSEECLDRLHAASLEILGEVGIDFYDEESRGILQEHGVEVRGETAYFSPEQIEAAVARAPSQFTQQARNPANNIVVGGEHMVFAPVYGPPFVIDEDRGRREATLEDFHNFVKLAYMTPYLHHSGGTIVEPTDEPTHTRHLDMVYAHIRYSDKAYMGSVTAAQNAEDSVRMTELLFGAESIRETPAILGLINISSPRRLDDRMLGAMKVYARARQGLIVTPFILSGAMAPVTVAGTVAQLNAEALAGIAFVQMVEPGCPVIYGAFQTNIDLQSGAPVFGSPESQLALYATAQLARRHNLPFRSGGMFTGAKIADAQSAYESIMVMLPTILARVNFVLHCAGWMEGGLSASYEKFVMDCELMGMFHKYLEGMDLSEEALAMESIRTVPSSGHHLGTEHTLRNFRTAFYRSDLFDYNSYEQWLEEGAQPASQRANARWKQLLADYEAPPLDPAIDEALRDYIERRKQEIPPEF